MLSGARPWISGRSSRLASVELNSEAHTSAPLGELEQIEKLIFKFSLGSRRDFDLKAQ